jgi:carbonic anhydrase
MCQSPINIKDSDSEFNKDLKLHFHYSPVKVKRDNHHHGQLVLDVEHLGHLDIHVPETKGFFKYVAKEVHFNGPSEHKFDNNRTDMEMQIIHEAPPGAIEPSDHSTPHHAIVSVLFKKEETHAIP